MADSGKVVAPAVEQPVDEAAARADKKSRERKPRQPKAGSHPPYFQMIQEAITALNEKSGSSPYAISKFIEEKHKSVLPANFRKILALQLKNSAARGKLIKIRASYKLSQAGKREKPRKTTKTKAAQRTTTTTTTRAARANAAKPDETTTAKTKAKRSKRVRSKSVNQIESKIASSGTTGRRTRKPATAVKPRQPKSIKKAKKA